MPTEDLLPNFTLADGSQPGRSSEQDQRRQPQRTNTEQQRQEDSEDSAAGQDPHQALHELRVLLATVTQRLTESVMADAQSARLQQVYCKVDVTVVMMNAE
ncbi:hypothetical protein BVRB_025720 [Beta vulgaris subsp. vulgaris]|uniref:Uncharacterized protein n=1 Tax=Beta vulgaris subsp. vulgaris TaxID=3555 RepID=A0A0J8B2B3_BETVV|nr:hypothetical protein BVRB_025720 [Beta vulgaris subsp. vulgaris]